MKVLFLLTQSLESPGGAGRFFPLAKELVKIGHDVTLVALHHDFKNLKNRTFEHEGVKVRYVAQMHVHKSGNHKQYYGAWKLLWVTAVATMRLTIASLTEPADVIHVCKAQPMNGIAAWIAHKIRKLPIYLDADDYEAGNNRFEHSWQQMIVAKFEDWLATFVQGITVNTTFIANHFRNLGFPPSRIITVPNGVDRDCFLQFDKDKQAERQQAIDERWGVAQTDRVVVYVGSISLVSHPIDLLLEAFAIVSEQNSNARLLIVGGGEDLDRMQDFARELGIQKFVRFVGKVPIEDTNDYYQRALVSVDPRRDTIAAESSLSLKLVESIVAGTPCITTDIGDRRQLLESAGAVVPPNDSHALAECILGFLQDESRLIQAQKAAVSMRESLFWDERIKAFSRIYDMGAK